MVDVYEFKHYHTLLFFREIESLKLFKSLPMAEETSSNVTGPTQKPSTPMGSRQSDHPSLMITTVKLD